jgi:hypothetical protein
VTEALLNGDHIVYKVEYIKPGETYCLVGNEDPDTNSVVSDYYGNFLDQAAFPDMCYTVPEDPCRYTWSDWSDCTFACKPLPEDDASNVQKRHTMFANPAECNKDVEVETKPCTITFTKPCRGRIFGGETGNECTCATDMNNVLEVQENTYTTQSGCKCGGTCVADGDCCQSYYKKCLADQVWEKNEDDSRGDDVLPEYRYLYFPCWQPQTCNTNDEKPSCTANSRGTSNFSNKCKGETSGVGREYDYYCMCSLEKFKCFEKSYRDQCCGGEDSYRTVCDFPKQT